MMEDFELYQLYHNPKTKDEAILKALEGTEPYIRSVLCGKFKREGYYEDIFQECRLAVIDALRTYNPCKKASFLTYCRLPIKHKICDFIARNVYKVSTYRQKKYGKVSFESYDYAEKDLPGVGFENSTVLKADLVSLLNRLEKRDRDIVVKFYIYGQSIKGIAESLGLPEALVERRKSLALKQLRDCLL